MKDQTGPNITSVVFSLIVCGEGLCSDFGLDTVYLSRSSGNSYGISGQITLGFGLNGVTVALNGGSPTTTTGSGNFAYTGLPAGGTYTVVPSLSGYQFNPPSRTFSNLSSNQTANFTATPISTTALQFVKVTPCRIADTRNPWGSFGGPVMSPGQTREFDVPNSACGIPSNAQAYSLNVTVVPTSTLGFLTIWPAGQSQPVVSTLNSDGRVKANAAIVPAGTNGGVDVFVTDQTHVILDIDGYFIPPNFSTLQFFPLTPCRIADTRGSLGALGGPSMSGNSTRTFPVLSSSCSVPATAQAYSLNVTAVPQSPLGYLTMWPTGTAKPGVSTLNASTGTVTANAAIVPAGSNGSINVYVTNDTDLIIDTNGYFAPAATGGLSLYTLTPCRIIDTRYPLGSSPFSGSLSMATQGGGCGVPSSAQAYVLNATVVPAGTLGWLTLWPDGTNPPLASTLNAYDGALTSNMALVPSIDGSIDAFAANPTYLILDVASYFAP